MAEILLFSLSIKGELFGIQFELSDIGEGKTEINFNFKELRVVIIILLILNPRNYLVIAHIQPI